MSGEWLIQIWAPSGKRAKSEHHFTGFDPLHAYAIDFRGQETDDILMVHLPSQATDEQRIAMARLGARFL